MSEYWKSLPRKYCDSCKCWFADNKASTEFHEKGKRHQENVQKRINEIQKRGLKEYKAKKQLENEMEKIEKAALAAFKKDMEQNPDLAAKSIISNVPASKSIVKEEPKPQVKESISVPKFVPSKKSIDKKDVSKSVKKEPASVSDDPTPDEEANDCKVWYEGKSEDGYTYYWNSATSESQWDPPEEGYISLEEQNDQWSATNNEETNEEEKVKEEGDDDGSKTDDSKDDEENSEENDVSSSIGPQPKPDPYGQWVTVEKKEEEYIDLQLPVIKSEGIEVHIPLPKEDKIKIREKTVGHIADDGFNQGESTFKKRKNLGNMKRNVRQRFDES